MPQRPHPQRPQRAPARRSSGRQSSTRRPSALSRINCPLQRLSAPRGPHAAAQPYSGGTHMRAKMIAAVLATAALVAPAAAQAHVSLHPNTIPAGAFATLDVRVPGEQEGAYVTKVDVLFPSGFTGVDYENVAGWSTPSSKPSWPPPSRKTGKRSTPRSRRSSGPGPGRSARSTTGSSSTSRCRWRSRKRDRQGARIQDRPDLQQRAGRPLDRTLADSRTPLPQDQRDRQGRPDRGSRRP